MSEIVAPSIDVVIPVYNAPVLTRRCIDSVVSCLSESIEHIYIQNDASNTETHEMLDSLPYDITHIYHSIKNQGFGASVNDAVSRSSASYILVLNSDTEINGNILPPLCEAMSVDSQLAVIIPASNDYIEKDFNRYLRQPGNYIRTYRLRGYAFLIRRSVFQEIGGFDPIFGRGYYEDIDLGRRIYEHNWRIGVHPDSLIYHKGGGSFGRGLSYRKLKRRNRALYFSRYPSAQRNVLFLSGDCSLTDFPQSLLNTIDNVFQRGGIVHWLSTESATKIPCLHMKNSRANLLIVVKLMMFYGWLRKDKRISDVWLLLPSNSSFLRKLLVFLSQVRGIKIITWKSNFVK
jgi:GT2 family glycosyltransferase